MNNNKFRAYDKESSEMIYSKDSVRNDLGELYFDFDSTGEVCLMLANGDDERAPEIRDAEIMTFTGICGKNGKPIFEGDLIKFPITINQYTHGDWQICKVIKRNGIFMTSFIRSQKIDKFPQNYMVGTLFEVINQNEDFRLISKKFYFEEIDFYFGHIEVLGNIYEHVLSFASNCCGTSIIENTDLCSHCKEHCEAELLPNVITDI